MALVRPPHVLHLTDSAFVGADGDPVSALLGEREGDGPKAGILFAHWGFGDRRSFAEEAQRYAGATTLCIDAPGYGKRKGPRVGSRDPRAVRAYAERFLGDLGRALDFLCAQPGVDPARIGFVGHSLGATIAPAFLARDSRVRAAALMAGTGALSRLWLQGRNAAGALSLADLDGTSCLPRVSASLLFQFGERDEFISRADAEAQVAAAREPKQAKGYASDHALDGAALRDRVQWLARELGLTGDESEATRAPSLPQRDLRRYRATKPVLRIAAWFSRRA